jgi:hypothetical protein
VTCILQNLTTLNLTPAAPVAVPVVPYTGPSAPMAVTPPAQPLTIPEPPAADPAVRVSPTANDVYTQATTVPPAAPPAV